MIKYKPFIAGTVGSLALLSFYALVMVFFTSSNDAIGLFLSLWPWMSLLIVGFGVQVGLFYYIHDFQKRKKEESQKRGIILASGGISTGSMIACCLHHVTEVLPFLGLSAAAVFFSEFQRFFLLLGITSNVVGIFWMLDFVQKQHCYEEMKGIGRVMRVDFDKLKKWVLIFGIIVVISYGLYLLWR